MRDTRTRDARLRDSIPHRLGKLFRVMARVYNKALVPYEVSSVQAHILATLWLGGPMTIGELQARLMLGSSTLTGAIDRMEKARLVRREAVASDRRASLLVPVEWPEKKRAGLLDTLAGTEDDIFAALSGAERKELARLLGKALERFAGTDDE
jgi:DNA-binding MarR family transcriptional regulator